MNTITSEPTIQGNQNIRWINRYGRTNFYPQYNSLNERVEAIQPVMPTFYQSIIPRYQLSTSETRDMGLGPLFDADADQIISRVSSNQAIKKVISRKQLAKPASPQFRLHKETGKGHFIDVLV